ncbi:MAG: hypothetical protein CFK52_12360, partial [Chloracidobacterium sp. CP2_5A]
KPYQSHIKAILEPVIDAMIEKQPCVLRRVAGDTILVPLRGKAADLDAIYVLNETAAFLWTQLEPGDDAAALVARLCQAFEATPAEAAQDVADFLSGLSEAGLIRFGSAARCAA